MIGYFQSTITSPVSETVGCWPVRPRRSRHEVGSQRLADDAHEESVWTSDSDLPFRSRIWSEIRLSAVQAKNTPMYEQAAVEIDGELSDRVSEHRVILDVQPEDSATAWFDLEVLNKSKRIKAKINVLFVKAQNIRIEAGMENELSIGIRDVIEVHGPIALGHIESMILQNDIPVNLARETLKYIGSFEMSNWNDQRRVMLENCLQESQYAWIRDGAGLGISFLDDPKSISVLERAIDREPNDELKEDLIQVLEQLEETLLES